MTRKIKFGVGQWKKPAPDRVIVWIDFISYLLVGLGGFSFITNHPDIAYGVTLLAGGVNKFGPRLFGVVEIQPGEIVEIEK